MSRRREDDRILPAFDRNFQLQIIYANSCWQGSRLRRGSRTSTKL